MQTLDHQDPRHDFRGIGKPPAFRLLRARSDALHRLRKRPEVDNGGNLPQRVAEGIRLLRSPLSCKQIVLDGRPACSHRLNPQQVLTPLSYPIRPPVAVFRRASWSFRCSRQSQQRKHPVSPIFSTQADCSEKMPIPQSLARWSQSVTAPLLADDTSLAYFANTPRV